MSFVKYLLYFIFLHDIIALFQINLDLTEWINNTETNLDMQHGCLHITSWTENQNSPYEIISYCMSEWPSKWNIQANTLDHHFTFAELYKQNITSQQLYLWSAPMDIVESYQFYLDHQIDISSELSTMETQVFYNCTLPRFGSICEYTFDDYKSDYSSLNKFIHDFYLQHKYQPSNLTCYTHLQCNRGTTMACLDWSEICDGKVHCSNDAIDEQYCWQLEINECKNEEFRCDFGQCISQTFLYDDPDVPDCLDGTDESIEFSNKRYNCETSEPSFGCEDVTCQMNSFEYTRFYEKPLSSSCVKQRDYLLVDMMFSYKPSSISDECWAAFRCTVHMPVQNDSVCRTLCENRACPRIIRASCPEMIFLPAAPILFGHIHLVYTKNDSQYLSHSLHQPQYVCYNDQLCGGFLPNKRLITLDNITCRRPQDFPLTYRLARTTSWLAAIAMPLYMALYKCNTFIRYDSTYCNKSNMYRCVNSSKCISKYRVYDGIKDCDYHDDEDLMLLNSTYSMQGYKNLFKCTTTDKYITYNKVGDGICDCNLDEYWLCDDEPDHRYVREHISFGTICDGFTELRPITIDGINETDETECEYWPCNNIYTRCDGFWNCFNGVDEVDCNPSPILNCPLRHHICISIKTKQLTCLPLEKANNTEIDCLGGIDEPKLCRAKHHIFSNQNFYCRNAADQSCISVTDVCYYGDVCQYGDDKQACSNLWNSSFSYNICQEQYALNRTDIQKYLCSLFDDIHKSKIAHFLLDKPRNLVENINEQNINNVISHSSIIRTTTQRQEHCHRGLPLRVWLDRNKNSTILTCLCPPSFYGDTCQYQNQRVSLTLKFQPFSIGKRMPFVIVITLIDDSDERTIHSHQQLTYLPMEHCKKKFNVYLLYSTRPKNETKHYFVHIDFYEKISLKYQGSVLLPLNFAFLPVYRIAFQLNIPHINDRDKTCSERHCIHGKCIKYAEDINGNSFCQCHRGWSGQYCTISYTCSCSSDSLCIGISANNRSICVCPVDKWGSRCLLQDQICPSKKSSTCENGGHCVPLNSYFISNKKFECICQKGFYGDRCEITDNKMILSFEKNIILPESILVHFLQVRFNITPEFGATFKNIPIYQNAITIFWSRPFHVAFVELFAHTYYLIVVQKTYNHSLTIVKTLASSDRCLNINEVFNKTILQLDLIRRVKYYHLPCQQKSSQVSCFYDEIHVCLCSEFGIEHHANCFEFNHTLIRNCSGQGNCENGGQCLQDSVTCPKTSICACSKCVHGVLCQFNSERFGLSLDAIIGDHIQPKIHIVKQSSIVQVSIVLAIIITLTGFLNSILSIITFNNEAPKKSGCGIYLLTSSMIILITMIIFALKFWILMIAQITYITNRSFLYFQCKSLDFLLRVGLNMDQWLSACVAIERAAIAIQGLAFDQKKSKEMAKYIILVLLLLTISTTIHDPFHRSLIDEDVDEDKKRIWCIISYTHSFRTYNSVVNIFHFFAPFAINFISAFVIIIMTTRQRITILQRTYKSLLYEQFKQHRPILFAPIILVILAIPRLIISFMSGCMKSSSDSWLFLAGYFISFIPPILTVVIFILPSKVYKEELQKCIKRYRRIIRTRLHLAG